MSVRMLLRRLRQDPGTVSLRPYEPLVNRMLERRDELRDDDAFEAALRELVAAAAAPGATLGSSRPRGRASGRNRDNAESRFRDDELVEMLAVASESSRRTLGLEPFAVQLLAATAMLHGRIVDMATGEGKTLVGFLVAAVQGIRGRRVHVLSANDYLAGRDAATGTAFFKVFGLDSAAVVDGMPDEDRRSAYRADVVYATVHQVGYDLLRDRQRLPGQAPPLLPEFETAVIDEIDAVLIDDALVPLVIAGDADAAPEEALLTELIRTMQADQHFELDNERRNVHFTEQGLQLLETALGVQDLYAEDSTELLTAAHVALHAETLLHRDVHYVVDGEEVRLVNDARGRVADRQRLPDGLHAAIERKERVPVTPSAEILDQILVESVVDRYRTVTGMSGSALEAAERLQEDLGLQTAVIPTNRPCIRVDEPDRLFASAARRDAAAVAQVVVSHRGGRPILIGTTSVAASERFAELLSNRGIRSTVLNAKNDAAEAEIIARAGHSGAVTVSTQMAGRGVDIVLDAAAADTDGLLVIGLGRYDSARLDRQLRGRAGRQGDPGGSIFFTSLEDDVVQEHLGTARHRGDGEIASLRIRQQYEHAQRVAEGELLQLHRTSRNYQTQIDRHRAAVLDIRERLLADPGELERYLRALWPDDTGAAEAWSASGRRGLATEVVLFHLDRVWAEHLNELAEVREGIHLRALGRQNPLEEFNILATRRLKTLLPDAAAASRVTLEEAIGDESLEDLGLRRPSATWTYMVADNPFGSEIDRVVHFGQRVWYTMTGIDNR